MGGLLTLQTFLKYFPEIDTVNPPPGSSSSHASNLQGPSLVQMSMERIAN